MVSIKYFHNGNNLNKYNESVKRIEEALSSIQPEINNSNLVIEFIINTRKDDINIKMQNKAVINNETLIKIKSLLNDIIS